MSQGSIVLSRMKASLSKAFDPSEARDDHGQWTSGAGSSPAPVTTTPSYKIPKALKGLAAEALKANTFEEFKKDYLNDFKQGRYYHVTTDPAFTIDSTKGPRDRSSMAEDDLAVTGKLMVTSDLDYWTSYYGKSRPYVAVVDMSDVPRDAYHQVNRGFGNEFWVDDPSKARVTAVIPKDKAIASDHRYYKALSAKFNSDDDLKQFYDAVKERHASRHDS